jgi:hypothetical protein
MEKTHKLSIIKHPMPIFPQTSTSPKLYKNIMSEIYNQNLQNIDITEMLYIKSILGNIENFSVDYSSIISLIIENFNIEMPLLNEKSKSIIKLYCDLLSEQKPADKSFAYKQYEMENFMLNILEDFKKSENMGDFKFDITKLYNEYTKRTPEINNEILINFLCCDEFAEFLNVLKTESPITKSTNTKKGPKIEQLIGGFGRRKGETVRNVLAYLATLCQHIGYVVSTTSVENVIDMTTNIIEYGSRGTITIVNGIGAACDVNAMITKLNNMITTRIIRDTPAHFMLDGFNRFIFRSIKKYYVAIRRLMYLFDTINNPLFIIGASTLIYVSLKLMISSLTHIFSPYFLFIINPEMKDYIPVIIETLLMLMIYKLVGDDVIDERQIVADEHTDREISHALIAMPDYVRYASDIKNTYGTFSRLFLGAETTATGLGYSLVLLGTTIWDSLKLQNFLREIMSPNINVQMAKFSYNEIKSLFIQINPTSFIIYNKDNRQRLLNYIIENDGLYVILQQIPSWDEIVRILGSDNP